MEEIHDSVKQSPAESQQPALAEQAKKSSGLEEANLRESTSSEAQNSQTEPGSNGLEGMAGATPEGELNQSAAQVNTRIQSDDEPSFEQEHSENEAERVSEDSAERRQYIEEAKANVLREIRMMDTRSAGVHSDQPANWPTSKLQQSSRASYNRANSGERPASKPTWKGATKDQELLPSDRMTPLQVGLVSSCFAGAGLLS